MIKKPDLAQMYTDAETLRIEKEMRKVYKDCEKDIKAKMTDFAQKHKVKDVKYRQMVNDGKMSKEDYDAWKQGQVFTGQQWKAKREQIANSLYNANDAAHKIAQGHVSNVFAFNANYMNYRLEKNVNANLGFGLYNNASVARLLRENPQLLPAKKLDKAKDVRWNMKNIKSELTKSIIQGESIDDLTERLSKEMPNRSFKQARVHARTMMTSAQNAGRLEAMYEHKAMGIQTMKVWLATLDERTRWMHRDLDGQERELDEYFEIGQYAIRFPADPLAAPAMVYNCRCTMEEKLKEYPDVGKMRRDNTVKPRDMSDENDGVIQYMTYNQWAEWKGVANERPNGMKPVMPVDIVNESVKETVGNISAWAFIGNELVRPRQRDYEDAEEFRSARQAYKEEKEKQTQRAEEWYNKNVDLRPMDDKEFSEWCSRNGVVQYGSIDGLDRVALRNYTNRYEKLISDFPIVKDYHDNIGFPFEIAYAPDRAYNAEASHGMTFGATYRDFKDTFMSDAVGRMKGEMIRGESPLNQTFDHEFGHQLYLAMAYKDVANQVDWTVEELHRRQEMKKDLVSSLIGKDGISEYAQTNDDELFAEAFSAWYGGEKTEFANAFGSFLKRWGL